MDIRLLLVKGYKGDNNKDDIIDDLIEDFRRAYYPEISIVDKNILINNIITHLDVMSNLPLMVVVKKIAEIVNFQINLSFNMCICDIGVIVADRIVRELMVLEYYVHKQNKHNKEVK